MQTFFSLFAGIGGADRGLTNLGLESLGGVEYNPQLVKIFNANHKKQIPVLNIFQLTEIPQADLIWVSPPCQSYSLSNIRGLESTKDIAIANQIVTLISTINPKAIILENVPSYAKSKAFEVIVNHLIHQGFNLDQANIRCDRLGLPTSRTRFICRASRSQLKPIQTTTKRQSWLDAIEPYRERLAIAQLTSKQQQAITNTKPDSNTFLIERCGYYHYPRLIAANSPAPTVRSHISHDGKGHFRTAYNVVLEGKAYKADIDCLAAWQDLKGFKWGLDPVAAGIGIGNAVPPGLASAVAKSL